MKHARVCRSLQTLIYASFDCRWWYPNKDSWHCTSHLFATGTWAIVHGLSCRRCQRCGTKSKEKLFLHPLGLKIDPAGIPPPGPFADSRPHRRYSPPPLSDWSNATPGSRRPVEVYFRPQSFHLYCETVAYFPLGTEVVLPGLTHLLIRAGALRDRPLGAGLLGRMCSIVLFVPKAYTS